MNDIPCEKLKYILTQYGRAICDDPRRCEGMLRDLCPEHKREVNVLMAALREGVAEDLMTMSAAAPEELVFARLRKRLYDNLGIAENFAHWAVESWALALGIIKVRTAGPVPESRIAPASPAPGGSSGGSPAKRTDVPPPSLKSPTILKLRSNPITVSTGDFIKVFNLYENQRPKTFIENDYVDNGNGTITDRATGLTWEKGGSDTYITYRESEDYIRGLNAIKFGGYDDWRLPTIEELLSLMEKKKRPNGFYINPIFDSKKWWCWSADRLPSSGGEWFVRFGSGIVDWYDLSYKHYVRGVRARQ
jgi:hypothetical protein